MSFPKFTLIHNWKQFWTFLSVQCMIAVVAINETWDFVPLDLRASLPNDTLKIITYALLGLGIIGRIIKKEIPDVVPEELEIHANDNCDTRNHSNDNDDSPPQQ